MKPDIAAIAVKTIDGQTAAFGDFAGRVSLVVNVASQCGFTPQYKSLEALYRRYRDAGLVVLGFPCDQFGHQEPGDEAAIQQFCSLNFGVSFPLFGKTEVNGAQAHPLFKALKTAAPGLLGSKAIKWNFTKFLLIADAPRVRRYAPNVKPADIAGDIEALLAPS